MSNRLKWKIGQRGKGIYLRNGDVHTWPLDQQEGPQHQEYVGLHNLYAEQTPKFFFAINPDGYVHDNGIGFENRSGRPDADVLTTIQQADPHLHQNKSPEDDWELDEQMPGSSETAARPDYNFVLGSEWSQMMNPGIPCPRCKSNDTVLQDENRIRCSRCRYVFSPPNLLAMADPSTQHDYDSDSFFHSKVAGTDYADELQQWLADIGEPEEPIAPTPHHQSPQDIAPRPPLAPANEPPYWPPGHVPDWADPSAEGRTSAEDALIERAITPAEYDAQLEPRKQRGPWLKRLLRRR